MIVYLFHSFSIIFFCFNNFLYINKYIIIMITKIEKDHKDDLNT